MKHLSVKMNTPCEFINVTPINPLISKCQIKVCYVGEEPNRNKSVITKEVAMQLANSLPGSPIVGMYHEDVADFGEHDRSIEISNGQVRIKDITKPYGFVDMNAKIWFQKFLDDGVNEHEYLMTEGYIWTGQYPEAKRIIEQGNNQSMELSEDFLNATWTKDVHGNPEFFIINEAIISKLCILGEDCEPCFEGSQITKLEFSFDDGFKNEMFSMMNELKEYLKEGGAGKVENTPTVYAVEIGDTLWSVIWTYIERAFPSPEGYGSEYRVDGIFEENDTKYIILQNRVNMKYYRLNFEYTEESGFTPSDVLEEVTKTYVPAEVPQFSPEAVEAYMLAYGNRKEEPIVEEEEEKIEGKVDEETSEEIEEVSEEENCPECGKPVEECDCGEPSDDTEPVAAYNLEEIPEYMELKGLYSELQNRVALLEQEREALANEMAPLKSFKKAVEKKEKEAMINRFYMLSDADKADVIENIDTYSLEDIEAKLSVICVRNKVSFDLDEEDEGKKTPITYSLSEEDSDEDVMPAWVRAVFNTAKTM